MDNMKTAIEIERKYIILTPDIQILEEMSEYSRSEIVQIYLAAPRGITHRIRRRTSRGVDRYYETVKVRIDACSANESEREISAQEFSGLLERRDNSRVAISKTRHAFFYLGQSFEIDVYPEWHSTCILETELESRDTLVEFPSFIKIVRDVTGVKEYSNASMARHFPPEETPTCDISFRQG